MHAPKAQKASKAPKVPKAQKHKDATKQKHKSYKRTNIKYALKKNIRRKKSLIRLFDFCAREEKNNRKKRKVSTM